MGRRGGGCGVWRQVLQQWEGRQPERRTLNQALEDVLSGEQVFQVRGWGGAAAGAKALWRHLPGKEASVS